MNTSQEDSRRFHCGRIDAGVGEGEGQHSEDLGNLGEGTCRGISPTANAFDNFDFNSNEGSSDAWVRRPLSPELPNVSESNSISRTGNVDGSNDVSQMVWLAKAQVEEMHAGKNLDGLIALYRQKNICWKGWK